MAQYTLWNNLHIHYAIDRHHFDRALVDILCIPGPRRKLHHPIDCLVCMEMAGTKQHS